MTRICIELALLASNGKQVFLGPFAQILPPQLRMVEVPLGKGVSAIIRYLVLRILGQ